MMPTKKPASTKKTTTRTRKTATTKRGLTRFDILFGLVVAGIIIFSFVKTFMITGAGILPAGTTATGGITNPPGSVCSTCAETGDYGKSCGGDCPDGQDCVIGTSEKNSGMCVCI